MNTYRILIVEDEVLIADMLARYLKRKGHEVVGMAISYEEAVDIYRKQEPEISLVDIRLSGTKTGIDFAKFIQDQPIPRPFIFLTSQLDQQTISKAKETFPAGYLSKPVQKESLFATIEIATHAHKEKVKRHNPAIQINDGTRSFQVKISEILFLQSEHVYVKVYLADERIVLQRSSLKEFLDLLPADTFLQTHRSYAVNVQHVAHWSNSALGVQQHTIPVSRARRDHILAVLNSN
ncbi:MAG: response regulator [Bacteroidota bacterium]